MSDVGVPLYMPWSMAIMNGHIHTTRFMAVMMLYMMMNCSTTVRMMLSGILCGSGLLLNSANLSLKVWFCLMTNTSSGMSARPYTQIPEILMTLVNIIMFAIRSVSFPQASLSILPMTLPKSIMTLT